MSEQLSQEVMDYVTLVKQEETKFLQLIASAPEGVDRRWQAVAKTHVQEGRMALVRSVTEK